MNRNIYTKILKLNRNGFRTSWIMGIKAYNKLMMTDELDLTDLNAYIDANSDNPYVRDVALIMRRMLCEFDDELKAETAEAVETDDEESLPFN